MYSAIEIEKAKVYVTVLGVDGDGSETTVVFPLYRDGAAMNDAAILAATGRVGQIARAVISDGGVGEPTVMIAQARGENRPEIDWHVIMPGGEKVIPHLISIRGKASDDGNGNTYEKGDKFLSPPRLNFRSALRSVVHDLYPQFSGNGGGNGGGAKAKLAVQTAKIQALATEHPEIADLLKSLL
jgi:hypothetical protein